MFNREYTDIHKVRFKALFYIHVYINSVLIYK